MNGPKEIPQEHLVELIDRNQERLELRIDNIFQIEKELAPKGKRYSKFSSWAKIIIIVLGAFVATRVVADRLWEVDDKDKTKANSKQEIEIKADIKQEDKAEAGSRREIEIIYTIISVAIAIVGGLDSSIKPAEISAEINFIKVRCRTIVLEMEDRWAREVEMCGVSREALDNSLLLLERIDNHYKDTLSRLAQLGIHLEFSDGKG